MIEQLQPIKFEEILKSLPPIEQMSEDKLARLCKIKVELDNREKNFPILYYKPQTHQEAFHKSVKKLRLVAGSNQSGKTHSSCAEGIMLSLGIHPYRKMHIPNKGRVVATDLQKGIGEVVQEKYEQLIPKSEIRQIKKYSSGQLAKIIYKNGSSVEFLSYEQDTGLFEGWVGDWVQFDEPPPRDKYIACMRGLMRNKGICWLALTPLSEAWVYDEIYTQAGESEDRPDVFTFDIRENAYLTEAEILDFEKRLTPDEKEARLHGKFRHLSGLIYKEFKPETHIIDEFTIPKDWERYCAMDYHPRISCAVLWLAVDPKGRCYAYDELWIDKTIKEQADLIKAKEGKDSIRARFIDPLSATPDRISGSSPQREFIKCGLSFRSATKDWITGKNKVQEMLMLDKEGKPGIYFLRNAVPKMIDAMLHYQWEEFAQRTGEKEQPAKKYGHFPDCLRYILVINPSYDKKKLDKSLQEHYNNQKNITHKVTGYVYGG